MGELLKFPDLNDYGEDFDHLVAAVEEAGNLAKKVSYIGRRGKDRLILRRFRGLVRQARVTGDRGAVKRRELLAGYPLTNISEFKQRTQTF